MQTASANAVKMLLPNAELAPRVAERDHAPFQKWMRRHNRSLFRTARSILKDDPFEGSRVQISRRERGARTLHLRPREGWTQGTQETQPAYIRRGSNKRTSIRRIDLKVRTKLITQQQFEEFA